MANSAINPASTSVLDWSNVQNKPLGTANGVPTLDANSKLVQALPDTSVTFAQMAATARVSLFRKNRVVNGNFNVLQRGVTSNTYSGTTGYLLDMWYNSGSTSTAAVSRQAFTLGQTEVPNEPVYFHRTVVTSGSTGTSFRCLAHNMESCRTLAGQTATLSFWAKADSNKNIAVELFQVFGTGGSPSAFNPFSVTTVPLTSTWAKKTIPVTIPSITGKTLGTNNDDTLSFAFWFDAGSNYNSRTNSLGSQSGTFDIAQVQLEPGTSASDFEYADPGIELMQCRRYYYRKVGIGTPTWLGTGVGNSDGASAQSQVYVQLPVTMRKTPLCARSGDTDFGNWPTYATTTVAQGVDPNMMSVTTVGNYGTILNKALSMFMKDGAWFEASAEF